MRAARSSLPKPAFIPFPRSAAKVAPSRTTGSAFVLVRFHTVTGCPSQQSTGDCGTHHTQSDNRNITHLVVSEFVRLALLRHGAIADLVSFISLFGGDAA